jgi:hypothetical protein
MIMNQTYVDHDANEWECSYGYSSIVRGFLELQVGIIYLPIYRREIDGYKVPSTHYKFWCKIPFILK